MACPLNATTGFQTIQGQVDTGVLESISLNTYPGLISFAPRQVPPGTVGAHVDESTNNTVTIKGQVYTLYSTQLCEPTHRGGFGLPGETKVPVLELVLTCFKKLNSKFSTFPNLVLLILPIYESVNQEENAGYLQQLVYSDVKAANLQTLFYQSENDLRAKSIQYNMCIDLVDPANYSSLSSLNALVLYFPNGCTVTQRTMEGLKAKGVTDYRLPPAILEAWATVMTYTVEQNGTKTPSNISKEGFIPKTPMPAGSDKFKNTFQYYTKPPMLTGKYNAATSPSQIATDKFQCFPLNEAVSVSGDYVVPTSATNLKETLRQKAEQRASELVPGITFGDIGMYIGIVVGVIVLVAIFTLAVSFLGGSTQEQIDQAAAFRTATASGVIPGTTGVPE
jgi:hypothetical protein